MRNRILTLSIMAGAVAACSDTTAPGIVDQPHVALSFTTLASGVGTASTSAPWFSVAAGDTVVSGSDSLVISRVQLVLREIELKRANHDACDSIMGDDDDCEEFAVGPLLLDLPLNGGVTTSLTVAIDTGSYDEIEFEIHKPDDDSQADSAFLAQHPDFARTSIRVEGTYNGEPFTYETDLNAEQEIEFVTPLVITDATAETNVTLRVVLDSWFKTSAGSLVDPRSANHGGANEGLVKDNIRQSFDAFQDQDRDGDDRDEDSDDS
ncbi:MAG TPA: hypothetical protein VGA37_03415 [Gemmatimonadales bacterium]